MVGVLCRISGDKEEGKDRSIHEQELQGKELADKLVKPCKIYTEINVSGTLAIKDRPVLEQLLSDIEDGVITDMYIWLQDRLERNPQTRFIVKQVLIDSGCKLYTENGIVDFDDDASEMHGDMMSIFNAYFVRTTKKRVRQVLLRNAEEGRVHGTIPYGYSKGVDDKYVINESEAKIVKRIYKESLSGLSTYKIADNLNSDDVPTNRNKDWRGSSILYLIKNTVYKGDRKFKSVDKGFVPIDPIIDSILWEKAQINLKNNRIYSQKPTVHDYLLNGIIKCVKCGSNHYAVCTDKNNFYRCSGKTITPTRTHGCDNRSINITRLDNLIWNRFFIDKVLFELVQEHFKNNDLHAVRDNLIIKLNDLDTELNTNINELDNITRLAVKGLLADEKFESELKRNKKINTAIKLKIHNVKEQLISFEESNLNPNDILNNLDKIQSDVDKIQSNVAFNDKKEIIKKYIKEIHVGMKNDLYHLQIEFNIPNMKPEYYIIHRRFKYAIEPIKEILFALSPAYDGFKEDRHFIKNMSYYFRSEILNLED